MIFDTLGGFVFDLFGKIPARYEKPSGTVMILLFKDWKDIQYGR